MKILTDIQKYLGEQRDRLYSRSSTVQLLVGMCILIVFAAVAIFVVDNIFIYLLARSYVEDIAYVLNLNKHLAEAIAFAVFLLAAYFFAKILSLSRTSRRIGYLGIVALLIGHSLLLWYGTKSHYFEEKLGKAKAIKCYVLTREGKVHFLEAGHDVDPETGLPCRDVTPTILERLREYEKGKRPERVVEEEPIFFDPRSGEPIIWYWMAKSGEIELFNLMGFNPENGEELKPVTSDVVGAFKKQEAERSRRPPQRVDLDKYPPFDPRTGQVRVWYWLSPNGDYEFYDNRGFHPSSGEPLIAVTKEILDEAKKRASQRCYIITPEAVIFGTHPGLDPSSGRQCRELTVSMLERLREYEKGNRPKRVTTDEPVFFDPRSGDPVIWFSKDRRGKIRLFDLMGFDPETGGELLPVTGDVAGEWKAQQERKRRPPQQVDPNKFDFFDPASGEPQVWYWRGQNGEYEFYDNQGFHPRTGEALKVVDKDVIAAWKQAIEKRQQEQKERERQQQILLEKRQKEQQEQQEQIERRAQSGVMCDQAAANPNDRRKPSNIPGVSYDDLKGNAAEALDICQVAMDAFPDELRYQYEYARALDFSDPDKSIKIYRKLTHQKYPAAFDNLGSLLLRQKDYSGAIAVFQDGAQFDDPDSLVSLANLYSVAWCVVLAIRKLLDLRCFPVRLSLVTKELSARSKN
jgi:hypothetical protein